MFLSSTSTLVTLVAASLLPLHSTLAFASNATFSLLARRSNGCAVLPIVADEFNSLIPCGLGSVLASCTCCDGGVIGCITAIETCSDSGLTCDCDAGYDCSDCPAQGLLECGDGCLPQGTVCCPGGTGGCPDTEQCCLNPDGSQGCCLADSTASSDAGVTTSTSSAAVATTSSSIDAFTTPLSTVATTTPDSPFATGIKSAAFSGRGQGILTLVGLAFLLVLRNIY